jgi:hypothetical protein
MDDAWPRKATADAIRAGVTVAKHGRGRANEPVVVERLDDRNARAAAAA